MVVKLETRRPYFQWLDLVTRWPDTGSMSPVIVAEKGVMSVFDRTMAASAIGCDCGASGHANIRYRGTQKRRGRDRTLGESDDHLRSDASGHENPTLHTLWWHSVRCWSCASDHWLEGMSTWAIGHSLGASVPCSCASSRSLTWAWEVLTVEIEWKSSNAGGTWPPSRDRTLGLLSSIDTTGMSSCCVGGCPLSSTALFRWELYKRWLAGLGSLSWSFLLRIHPSESSHSSLTHPTWLIHCLVRLESTQVHYFEWLHLEALGDCVLLRISLVTFDGCCHLDGLII
jgi:hypothetical protein